MILYKGTAKSFSEDNKNIDISSGRKIAVDKLINEFVDKFRREPEDAEIRSWENSLKEISEVFDEVGLVKQGVFLEYQLPLSSKRLDCMVIGINKENVSEAVVIELKQWQTCDKSNLEDAVVTMLEGKKKLLLHPSVQVGNYIDYLKNATDAFNENESKLNLSACVYLHNYIIEENDSLVDSKFNKIIFKYPIFVQADKENIKDFIREKVSYGVSKEILEKIATLKFETNKRLNDSVVSIIKGNSEYVLLDEQKLAFNTIIAAAESSKPGKKVLIINGGPGTGKSVIAINILAYFLRNKRKVNYATGSKWFTKNLRAMLKGTNGEYYFKYFNQYNDLEEDSMDILICDESHRIRGDRDGRSGLYQIEQLIRASKVSVFFIDNNQHIRANEIGTSQYIRHFASKYKNDNKCDLTIWETNLEAQFRCGGMDGFINWIDNTLDIEKTANILWKSNEEGFDFKICSSPEEIDNLIRKKAEEGYKSRMMAGFCWPWNEEGNKDGTLANDVKIDDYERPWNPSDKGNYKVKQNFDIPKPELWATDSKGIDQIGCVYTVQGFEFDYVGVIFGNDLLYDEGWQVNKDNSYDPMLKKSSDEEFMKSLKNIYRVLLSRGIKGCYVYFMDKDTERFFKSRIED
ncbi:peptidase S24 [Clostridium beijerinckii]|nr:peptidase S24 [Clostridium beijerinckii]